MRHLVIAAVVVAAATGLARAQDLEAKVASFFQRVRAA